MDRVAQREQTSAGRRNLAGVLAYLRRYPGRALLCLSLLLVNIAIEMSLPQIIGQAINQLRWAAEWGAESGLGAFVAVMVSLVVVRAGVGRLLGPIRARLIQDVLADIRSDMYDAIQRLEFAYHDTTSSGELISRSTTDIWRLQDFLFACLFLMTDIAIALVVTITLIWMVSGVLGALALATIVPTIALIGYYASRLRPQWRAVHDLHGAMTTVIQENIAGVRVVKAFAREQAEISKFTTRRDEFLRTLLNTVNYWAARVPFAQFLFGLGLPLALWAGGREVIEGRIEVGDLAKVVLYFMAVGHRVGMVGQLTNILQNASASAERVLEVIHKPPAISSGRKALPAGPAEVRFEEVSVFYSPTHASLDGVSFTAAPGTVTAIVGPTGSGKSTLVNLIPRFYDPSGGQVRINGVDVRELDLVSLRRAIGIIFQETFLFSATVAENIAFGKPGASMEEIERCARAAQAHEFIAGMEAGYETVVGERGVTLSGGQKQRIAIARAFLMEPRILILDDATAAVDSQTERAIQEALAALQANRTTFVIAHRAASVLRADQILVLNEGRIVEQGTHSELRARGGFYCELFERQLAAK